MSYDDFADMTIAKGGPPIAYQEKLSPREIKKGTEAPLLVLISLDIYPIDTRLNSATVNPFVTVSRYCATVFELSFTKI